MQKTILSKKGILPKLLSGALKWHIGYFLSRNPFPIACGMYVTNICNFKCRMCNIWRNSSKNTISMELFKKIVDELSGLGVFYFSISGGEPFILKDIFDRIRYAKERLAFVHVVSNGSFLDEEAVRELSKTGLDEISISIDGPRAFHDELRGVEGAYDGAIRAIDNMRRFAPHIPVSVNSIIMPHNTVGLQEILDFVNSRGLCIKFQPLNQHPVFPNQERSAQETHFREDNLKEVKAFTEKLRKEKRVLNSDYFLSIIPDFFSGNTTHGIFADKCLFPQHHVEIREDGSVFPCLTGMDWRDGFEMKGGLKGLLSSDQYRARQKTLRDCKLCRTNMYVCYFETRITFPIGNFLKYGIRR